MAGLNGSTDEKLSLRALTALVVGSMIGSGIFALPATFARATGGFGAMIAWAIAGTGMLMLAFVFQTLAKRRPDLDSGIFAYARAGFGPYLGFVAAAGYWIGACFADTACLILIKSTLGQFFPIFGDGTTLVSILSASVLVWGCHYLVLRGVKSAAALNAVATYAKIIPIGLFLFVMVTGFQADIFAFNFWGGEVPSLGTLAGQVRATMLVTVFVFVGIEGASVYSRYAKRREDVGIATVLGFLGVLSLLVLVTMLSYGVMLRPDLQALATPSMAGVMAHVVGPWGGVLVSVGLLISVLGNYLSWSLLAAEVVHSAAREGSMPSFLAKENAAGAPAGALWLTNLIIQLFLIVSWFAEEAFLMALKMTGVMTLVPYLLVAAYGVQLAWTRKGYVEEPAGRNRDLVCAVVATLYACLMIIAGGSKYLVLSALLYLPSTLLFVMAMREQKQRVFKPGDAVVFGLVVVAAAVGVYGLASGVITI
ncbi:basic amino acid/polyamine antiporter [Brevundimonas lenta]|uniref:Arginine:ornithine antiporter/lysine permease n=1 Tax=Brevundimonas lenta TaxID=424796 RepID=A0A7W6JEG5_9CAUL|nr:basic amino acid/polyamine antiporter [Brevundimonas lenta]MBB4083617.1 arginine:ornithine antiporter/lysine permease [Brevundimonas lenta]